MSLNIDCIDRSRFKGDKDTLALFMWEGEKIDTQGWFDSSKERVLEDITKRENFKAKAGDLLVYYPEKGEPSARVILVGLGKKKDAKTSALRDAAARALKATLKQSETLWIDLPKWSERATLKELAQAATEGALLGQYRYLKHKSDEESKKESALKRVNLVVEKPEETTATREGIKKGEIFAEATKLVRDLVNEPPSQKRPADLAKIAKSIGSARISVRVYTKKELEKMGMNAILGVSSGSSHEPVFVHMVYKPKGTPKKHLGIVGKGITFDSGGLNIKTGNNMTTMKNDMSGGATVLAVLKACEKLELPHEIHGFVPFTENMPGGDAYKPGDVVRAYNGKTIEILNTDAEGRVVLADALSFASKKNLDSIVDLATLTGAVVVALGDHITGLMGNNEKLIEEIKTAAKTTGEKVWQMPLAEEYKERIRGGVGDLANISTRGGSQPGTIIAGLFLQEFVDGKPWAHLDIAGTAWTDVETPTCPPGGTGAMVRTLLEYLLQQ